LTDPLHTSGESTPSVRRVLFAVRPDLEEFPGGDTVQVRHTAAALKRLGVDVTVSSDPTLALAPFDCVHLWHLERVHETYVHMVRARAEGKPIVLSPLYWDGPERRVGRWRAWVRLRENAKNLFRLLRARFPRERASIRAALRRGWAGCRQDILDCCDAILPNSSAEADLIATQAPPGARIRVVVNGIDADLCRCVLAKGAGAPRRGVLCVAHFDPRKNQLGLIEALRDTDVPVTFVGEARRMHARYYGRCRRAAGAGMRFLGLRRHSDVLRHMLGAEVHACPSFFETPGLANLEAAALGCRLALGDCAPVREYFGPDAVYVDGRDPAAIRDGVQEALRQPAGLELSQRVMTDYRWETAAESTLAVYRDVIESAPTEANSSGPEA